jgi:hypothetical protein
LASGSPSWQQNILFLSCCIQTKPKLCGQSSTEFAGRSCRRFEAQSRKRLHSQTARHEEQDRRTRRLYELEASTAAVTHEATLTKSEPRHAPAKLGWPQSSLPSCSGRRLKLKYGVIAIGTDLSTNILNMESAVSRIMDVDIAEESATLARSRALQQAGTAMLAQANQSSQSILKLIDTISSR